MKYLIIPLVIGVVLGVMSVLFLGDFVVYIWIIFLAMTLVGLRLSRSKPNHTASSVAQYLEAGLRDGSIITGKSAAVPANEVFDMLVSHAGAIERHRGYFVGAWGNVEVSFEGDLGKGGKFWINGDRFNNNGKPYINCYPEDLTPERKEIIEKVNGLLAVTME